MCKYPIARKHVSHISRSRRYHMRFTVLAVAALSMVARNWAVDSLYSKFPDRYGRKLLHVPGLPSDEDLNMIKEKILKGSLSEGEDQEKSKELLVISEGLSRWDKGLLSGNTTLVDRLMVTVWKIHKWNAATAKANAIIAGINLSDKTLVGAWVPSIGKEKYAADERVSKDVVFRLETDSFQETASSVLFGAAVLGGGKSFVIKYTNSCLYASNLPSEDLWSVYRHADTLVDEYVIMKVVEGSLIAPKAHRLSVPVLVGSQSVWDKNPKLQIDASRETCYWYAAKLFVRGIIEDKVGPSVENFFLREQKWWFREDETPRAQIVALLSLGLRIGVKVMGLVEELHSHGFLHNDVHSGNVAFVTTPIVPYQSPDLVLIDFGHSGFYPTEMGNDTTSSTHGLSLGLLSPWHLQRIRKGRRDDVYRTVEMVADILTRKWDGSLSDVRAKLEDDRDDMIKLKQEAPFFTAPLYGDNRKWRICKKYSPGIKGGFCEKAMLHMQLALQEARAPASPDSEPNYSVIKQHMKNAIEELTRV